ncbi:MAG TPA: type IV toxin-antitoxin system AbiEi family antitoxin domain-containing protein [Nocardioides sp.]|nr:type IV toxin-antitoxin system AbiEi family antitoxin domain-containing protein [Nocardioides sp.]
MDLLGNLAQQRGYFLRREALGLGCDDKTLHRGVRSGALVRIRQGAYSPTPTWRAMDEQARFLARSLAAYELSRDEVHLSHTSALAAYGCPLWRVRFDRVHLTYRGSGTTRVEAGVTHHTPGTIEVGEYVERNGIGLASPALATIGGLSLMGLESCLIAGDWMLHEKLTDAQTLWDLKTRLERHPKTRHLEVALRMLDGRSASPGESRARFLFWRMGVPCPDLQHDVVDENGLLIGTTDFAWPDHNTYGEFDGRLKYGRLLKSGQTAGDAVFAEKQREDAIRRATGGTVVRWTWDDLTADSAPSRQLLSILRRRAA